jgi:pimeloyl-ACP methyl ester carboxylesterase
VPYTHGSSIAEAWPGAELFTTTGLGHRAILRDPEVVRRTVEFLGAGAGA